MFAKKIVMFVLCLSLLLVLLAPAMAQDTNPTPVPSASPAANAAPEATPAPLTATTGLFVTSQFRVNVRSGPGTEFTILGKLTPADSLDITGQNTDATWLRVNFNGQEGWMFAKVVDVTGALETAPVVEAGPTAVLREGATLPSPATSGNVMVVTRFNTNLRSTFSTDADVLQIIPFNTTLQPQGRTDNGNWIMVTFGDQSGWLFAPILFFSSGEVESLPVMGTEPTASAAATTEPQASPTSNP